LGLKVLSRKTSRKDGNGKRRRKRISFTDESLIPKDEVFHVVQGSDSGIYWVASNPFDRLSGFNGPSLSHLLSIADPEDPKERSRGSKIEYPAYSKEMLF
jgi:hypothetical protein